MTRSEQMRMRGVLAQLPVLERQVYELSAAEGLSYPAIAQRLGIEAEEVEALLAAAIVKLDQLL